MSRTILVTGGGASGKSRWAITQFEACDNVLYLCPDEELDTDTKNRIDYGNKRNYVEWDIHTGVSSEPKSFFRKHKFAIFDSLSSYTFNTIQEMCPDISKMDDHLARQIEKRIIEDVSAMYDVMHMMEGDIVIITLETGFSITPDNPQQRWFRKILGIVNQRIANISSDVYLSVSGIQFKIK